MEEFIVKNRENNILWKLLVVVQRAIIMVSLSAVTLIIAGACILRVFGINFTGFEELATIAVFWLYMIGSSHGSYEKSQITADILEVLMPDSLGKNIMKLVKWIALFILGCIFAWWAWGLVSWSLQTMSVTSYFRIPIVTGQIAILIGLIISCFYNLVYMMDEILMFIGKKPRPEVAADEAAN